MLEIFGHRATLNGIENNISTLEYYEKLRMGIELDLRYGKNGVYLAHDPQEDGDLFEDLCKKFRNSNIKMALHIKESEAIYETIELLKKYSIHNYFLFNTENFNTSNLEIDGKIAAYLSNKKNQIKEKILWCDEIEEKWYSEEMFLELHNDNKVIYSMSLELVKTCNETEIVSEWERLINLGVDGICTKYPKKLLEFVKGDLN